MTKIIATKCYIFRLKCTKFDVGCGSTPDPARGAYSVSPTHSNWLQGVQLLRKEGREQEKGCQERERRRGGKKKKRERGGRAREIFRPPWLKPRSAYGIVKLRPYIFKHAFSWIFLYVVVNR